MINNSPIIWATTISMYIGNLGLLVLNLPLISQHCQVADHSDELSGPVNPVLSGLGLVMIFLPAYRRRRTKALQDGVAHGD